MKLRSKIPLLIGGVIIFVAGVAFCLCFLFGVEFASYPPPRADNLSPELEWAGGYDGGYWVRCRDLTLNTKQLFACEVYSEQGDCLLANDTFRPFKVIWDSVNQNAIYEELDHRIEILDYNGFNDGEIFLSNNIVLRQAN